MLIISPTPYRGTKGYFKTVAHHEAAHAVVCVRFGIAFRYVQIGRNGGNEVKLSRCRGAKGSTRLRIEREIIMALAGNIAMGRFDPAVKGDGALPDTLQAYDLAADLLNVRDGDLDNPRIEKFMVGMRKNTEAIVAECWPKIRAVAKELQARKRLEFSDVKRICAAVRP